MLIDDPMIGQEGETTVDERAGAERIGLRKVPERIDAL